MSFRKPSSNGSAWPAKPEPPGPAPDPASGPASGHPARGRPGLIHSFAWAASGLAEATRRERNLRLHWLAAYSVLAAGLFFDLQVSDWLWLFLAIALVIGAELMNTAVEATVDLLDGGPNRLAGLAKDAAAGAVLVVSLFSVAVAALVFLRRGWLPMVLWRISERPYLAAVLALGLVPLAFWATRAGPHDGRKC